MGTGFWEIDCISVGFQFTDPLDLFSRTGALTAS